MIATRDPKANLRLALVLFAVLAVAILCAGSELQRLSDSRSQIHKHSQMNLDESRTAARAQDLVAQQGAAIRDLVLATEPQDIQEAETRFDELGRHYDAVQERLLGLFAADSETSDEERSLFARIKQEQLKTIEPFQRVVALALRNQDELATKILIEEVLPHQFRLRRALADLDAVQQSQNQALEHVADDEYSLAFLVTVSLAALGTLLVVITGWIGTRAVLSNRASAARRRRSFTA